MHSGLMYYTIGQRQGLGIGGVSGASDEPWYVVNKDLENNQLIVAQGNHDLLYTDSLIADRMHWLVDNPQSTFQCTAKTRYRQPDQACKVTIENNGDIRVGFIESQRAVTPGQFIVLYKDDLCLGGAVIRKRYNREDSQQHADVCIKTSDKEVAA